MRELAERNLIGAGLIALETEEQRSRYNRCLLQAGIEPVELPHIDIDGAGWSPQVAHAKGDSFYLSQGPANPLAIIVTPKQYKRSVYMPPFSWVRRCLRSFFDRQYNEIADVTATHGIVIDFDNGLGEFTDPSDLLLLRKVRIVPNTDGLAEAAGVQAALVAHAMSDLNCLKEEVRDKLACHVREHGDLRKRRVMLKPSEFESFQDFRTTAFGGVTVLRGSPEDFLIFEDKKEFESAGASSAHGRSFYLHDDTDEVFTLLRDKGWFSIPQERFVANPEILAQMCDALLAWSICDSLTDIVSWEKLSTAQRKGLLKRHRKSVPPIYHELERFTISLKEGKSVEPSPALWFYLAEPAEDLHPATKDVLALMLAKREPRNLMRMYTADKNFFLSQYRAWRPSKQLWSAQYLGAYYVHEVKRT